MSGCRLAGSVVRKCKCQPTSATPLADGGLQNPTIVLVTLVNSKVGCISTISPTEREACLSGNAEGPQRPIAIHCADGKLLDHASLAAVHGRKAPGDTISTCELTVNGTNLVHRTQRPAPRRISCRRERALHVGSHRCEVSLKPGKNPVEVIESYCSFQRYVSSLDNFTSRVTEP